MQFPTSASLQRFSERKRDINVVFKNIPMMLSHLHLFLETAWFSNVIKLIEYFASWPKKVSYEKLAKRKIF